MENPQIWPPEHPGRWPGLWGRAPLGRRKVAKVPQSFSRLLVHLVFSTKHRQPFLESKYRDTVHGYLATVLESIGCPPYQIGGIEDHVHLFFGLSRTLTTAEVVERLKTSSSKWIKEQFPELSHFYWQSGYGAFSVSQSEFDKVVHYVAHQEEHHRKQAFQDEYRKLLKLHHLEFDERYMWD